jgi:hypothetical protein
MLAFLFVPLKVCQVEAKIQVEDAKKKKEKDTVG